MFGFDLDAAELHGSAPAAPAPLLRPEIAALVARMAPAPARMRAMDALVGALADAGVWAKLVRLLVLAAHSPQAALLNWTGAESAPVGGGASTFIARREYWCHGLDGWIDSGLAPAAGTRF